MDSAFESTWNAFVLEAKAGKLPFKMAQSLPEEFFHEVAVAGLIGMRQSVAGWRGGSANGCKLSAVNPKSVADIIQSEGMGELSIEQRDDMTPWTKASGLLVDTILVCKFGNETNGNELANLSEDGDF